MISLRRATRKDAEHIVKFQIQMAKETEDYELDKNLVTQGVNAVLSDPHKGWYLVAEIEDKVVGSLMITYEWSDWRNSTILWIQSLFILEPFRGKGIFNFMYEHIQHLVNESNDYCGIRLYVDKTNEKAIHVYDKIGMTREHYDLYEWME